MVQLEFHQLVKSKPFTGSKSAVASQAGLVQFAVDADGALNFAVAGGGLRQQLRLRGEGSAAGCFQFRGVAKTWGKHGETHGKMWGFLW